MKRRLAVLLCALLVPLGLANAQSAKDTPKRSTGHKGWDTREVGPGVTRSHGPEHAPLTKPAYRCLAELHQQYNFMELRSEGDERPLGAALGWYTFDTAAGAPTKQGWTEHDLTKQVALFWHVDGIGPSPCNNITPINGAKSMWCGQWSTTAEPWCSWSTLPGYGNNWDQNLETTVDTVTTLTYTIMWDCEAWYDFTYVEWWDPANSSWVLDTTVNGGQGSYDGSGGPLSETATSSYGPTKVRFHFVSDGTWSDEDGFWMTSEGAVKVDDLAINGGPVEDWESEPCRSTGSADDVWVASIPPAFGNYAALHSGATTLQEDPCLRDLSNLWGFFDNPAVTNYACGGWPMQGAIPYGPDANGLFLSNEIWSPWISLVGAGTELLLQFLTYRDLPLDYLQFYVWHVRTRDNDTGGCPTRWKDHSFVYYGGHEDFLRTVFDVSAFIRAADDDIQIALGAVDMCPVWCGLYGTGWCHSHAPLFDEVKLAVPYHPEAPPRWLVRDIDLWQDNFPELGGVGPTDYARCDMARDVGKGSIVPGDALEVIVTDPNGLAADNTGGRSGKAVYVFVRVTDRFGNPIVGKSGLAIQSPDVQAFVGDPNAGLLRWPWAPVGTPLGWDAYRMDYVYTSAGVPSANWYCADLMDLAAGPHNQHINENQAGNVGIFAPGDVIWYFFGAKNTLGQWSYWHRTFKGQGVGRQTADINGAVASPCEWSVLPDAGRFPGDAGDILYVDDADDRGGQAQLYFDWAFRYLGIEDRVDRFDVLGPSSCVGNSLASRVKNIQNQIIGDPIEIYQKVVWNSSDLSVGLMGDGGAPNGGSSAELSDDFALCDFFLRNHPDNPGWAYWGDDVVQDWSTLVGASAVAVRNTWMNHQLSGGDQRTVTGVISPMISSVASRPWSPESFFAFGGCPAVNDFDMPIPLGPTALAGHRYQNQVNATASVYQATPNVAGSTARFFLAGFGFNFIRDDDLVPPPDYVNYLRYTLLWFENILDEPIGIDPLTLTLANRLESAYPNPFNPTTTIKYTIAEAGHVTLKVYDVAGQLLQTLVDEEQAPRAEGFAVAWDGTSHNGAPVASGVYFYKLATKGFSQTKKMVLVK